MICETGGRAIGALGQSSLHGEIRAFKEYSTAGLRGLVPFRMVNLECLVEMGEPRNRRKIRNLRGLGLWFFDRESDELTRILMGGCSKGLAL